MVKEKVSKRPSYNARVEYWAVQPEVESRLTAGHRIRPIYEELFNAGRLTMSYTSFCAYVRGRGQRKELKKQPLPVAPLKPALERPKNQVELGSKFVHSRTADLEELGPPLKPP